MEVVLVFAQAVAAEQGRRKMGMGKHGYEGREMKNGVEMKNSVEMEKGVEMETVMGVWHQGRFVSV